MKKLRCKKEYGTWFYKIERPEKYGTSVLRFPIYILQKEDGTDGGQFGTYADMKYYVETGKIL